MNRAIVYAHATNNDEELDVCRAYAAQHSILIVNTVSRQDNAGFDNIEELMQNCKANVLLLCRFGRCLALRLRKKRENLHR